MVSSRLSFLPVLAARAPAALLAGLILSAAAAQAATIKVPQDQPTINAAIKAASPGDRIKVSSGHYPENVVVDVPDLEIDGRGATIDGRAQGPAVRIVAENVTLSRFTIRNGIPGIDVEAPGVVLERNEVAGCLFGGIVVLGDDAVIERNEVRFCEGPGIDYAAQTDPSETVIERNDVHFNSGIGILAFGGRMLIDKNDVAFNRQDGIAVDAGLFEPAFLPQVTNNKIECNGLNGICVFSTGLGILVEDNRIEGNGRSGIEIVSGLGALVVDNRICENGNAGVSLTSTANTVRDNRIQNNADDGIRVQSFGEPGLNIIDKNKVKENGRDGISVVGQDNVVRNNDCDDNLGDGIDLDSNDSGNIINNNKCKGNAHEGIDNSGVLTEIRDNKCKKNGLGDSGIDIAGAGNDGVGTVSFFDDNTFDTGGQFAEQLVDL